MSLVRILVDGYSLLHKWPELAPGHPRHSGVARQELVRRLTLYQDAIGTPVTIFFDGGGRRTGTANAPEHSSVEVLYSLRGQTADQLIERAAHRFAAYGQVLAVTDDLAERATVMSLGGACTSCSAFIEDVRAALAGMAKELKRRNQRERQRFGQRE